VQNIVIDFHPSEGTPRSTAGMGRSKDSRPDTISHDQRLQSQVIVLVRVQIFVEQKLSFAYTVISVSK
jgi:hypothetical protein